MQIKDLADRFYGQQIDHTALWRSVYIGQHGLLIFVAADEIKTSRNFASTRCETLKSNFARRRLTGPLFILFVKVVA